jgi:hypothetical protein
MKYDFKMLIWMIKEYNAMQLMNQYHDEKLVSDTHNMARLSTIQKLHVHCSYGSFDSHLRVITYPAV